MVLSFSKATKVYHSLISHFGFYRRAYFSIILCAGFHVQCKSQASVPTSYPKITGYVAVIHPIVTISGNNKPSYNFNGAYVGGLVTGINIWKSAKIGFSLEFVPFIRADKLGSKMNNFLFHPGVLVALGKGFTFAGRAAFETSGRYGLTPVIAKVVKRSKGSNFYIAIPAPVRFGNNQSLSIGVAVQLGISF